MNRLLRLAAPLFLAALLAAADAPTREEWQPVQAALATQAADASARLQALTVKYPRWVDGYIEAARTALAAGRADEAWKNAREALKIERANGDAAALAVQALAQMGRHDDALKLAKGFVGNSQADRQSDGRGGMVAFYAASAALTKGDTALADECLRAAKAAAGDQVPPAFLVLGARLAVVRGDLAAAETALQRAVTADPQLHDAWFELGRVRCALAEANSAPAGKRVHLEQASDAFTSVTRALPKDHEAWLGLGLTHLALARVAIASGGEGGSSLRSAAQALREAVAIKPDQAPPWIALGETLVRLELWADAAEALTRARALGVKDAGVRDNLALALEKSGKIDEALALHAEAGADQGMAALVSMGIGSYKAKRYPAAIEVLGRAAAHPDLTQDSATRGQLLRFIGHAWRESAVVGSDHERFLEAAAKAYLDAGDLGDRDAIAHYAALQSSREPTLAYAAGWQLLHWNGWFSGRGWAMVIGSYGAARAWANPLHYIIWGMLVGLPFLLWIGGFLRKPAAADVARSDLRAARRKPPEGGAKPLPAPTAEASALTARKDKARPTTATPARKRLPETEPVVKPKPRPTQARKPLAETEELPG